MDSLPTFYEYLGQSLYFEKEDICYICEENNADIMLECNVSNFSFSIISVIVVLMYGYLEKFKHVQFVEKDMC
jgi:hypothetical protein